jgi:hypothetical protein
MANDVNVCEHVEMSDQLHTLAILLLWKVPLVNSSKKGGSVGPRIDLDVLEEWKTSCWHSNHYSLSSAYSLVTAPTMLSCIKLNS